MLEKSLSVCCGDGAHELAIARTGKVRFIHGFDISEGAIAQANLTFEKAAVSKGSYAFEVADANDLRLEGQFDLLLSTGALHHVTNLEGLLSKLSSLLSPDGYFIVLEYVGPNRFQWTDAQLGVINGILRQLDFHYLKENTRTYLGRSPIADLIAIDPSEAVHSEDILRLLPEYFRIEYLRNFNGTVMHPLYPLLNAELTNTNSPDFDSLVRMILLMENTLIRANVLPSDFVFAVCRNRKPAEGTTRPHSKERPIQGCIDLFDDNSMSGWVADLGAPDAPVTVDVYIDDQLEGTVLCDGFRQDVKDAGYGDGRKGFRFILARPSTLRRVVKVLVAGFDQVIATQVYDAE
jgi:SAM-dependent methyltransferase